VESPFLVHPKAHLRRVYFHHSLFAEDPSSSAVDTRKLVADILVSHLGVTGSLAFRFQVGLANPLKRLSIVRVQLLVLS